MPDITAIPTQELRNDRIASLHDIRVCELSLLHGITEYSGGSVQDRLDTNKKIITVIDDELARRRAESAGAVVARRGTET